MMGMLYYNVLSSSLKLSFVASSGSFKAAKRFCLTVFRTRRGPVPPFGLQGRLDSYGRTHDADLFSKPRWQGRKWKGRRGKAIKRR